MTLLQITALLLVLAAAFGAINYLFLRLPAAIGVLVVALAASLGIIFVDWIWPAANIAGTVTGAIRAVDFSATLLEGMLGLLLFAGALHLKLSDLKNEWMVVLLMATLGIGLSTAIVGTGFSWITGMPLMIALVFGALISPTDPVAVLGVLRAADLNKTLETKIAGESLFNDGVGYVVFLVLVGLAFPSGDHHGAGLSGAVILFVQEALGGAVLGIVLGWLTFRVMRLIDDPALEVLITLALAFGGYALALKLHMSGPIMAVCAGLLIGHKGPRGGMSEATRGYVDSFWTLVDEILNAVLFLMIGFEVLILTLTSDFIWAITGAIVLALFARFAAVVVPVMILRPFKDFEKGVVPVMTWGGIKGGISIALALSLPQGEWTPLILTCTYGVVLFSIIVQGLTVAPLSKRVT